MNAKQTRFVKSAIKQFEVSGLLVTTLAFSTVTFAQTTKSTPPSKQASATTSAADTLIKIMRAEDERRYDNDLSDLFQSRDAKTRARAILSAGRIGDSKAVAPLINLLQTDSDVAVRAMAAFALGEIESAEAENALVIAANEKNPSEIRARAVEALGKIAGALPRSEEKHAHAIGDAVLNVLRFENGRRSKPDENVILLGITAVLRSRPEKGGEVVAEFLDYSNARIRADAANTLARLRSKDGLLKLRGLVLQETDPIVRANVIRALAAADDQTSLAHLVRRIDKETDPRTRVTLVRSLGSLKDPAAASEFLGYAKGFLLNYISAGSSSPKGEQDFGMLLEFATALSRIYANSNDVNAIAWIRQCRDSLAYREPEIETAFARINPGNYLRQEPFGSNGDQQAHASLVKDWKQLVAILQGVNEIGNLKPDSPVRALDSVKSQALGFVKSLLDDRDVGARARSAVLRSYATFKPSDLADVLRKDLTRKDPGVVATAADLLGDLPPDDANRGALAAVLQEALKYKSNDAALAILGSLAKQKNASATELIKATLDASNHLIRRRAVALLKESGAGDFSSKIGTVTSRNTDADYRRALSRLDMLVSARVATTKGTFTIEFLAEDAPLNVDNFVMLAKRRYFDGLTYHRVVPNFVIQTGDPQGDGDGGPGYDIRCEINEVPYDRGMVGMALSGKDTGGSQWFVTHSPQPHLDGGYTVFGRVTEGMEVVERIQRGDVIKSIVISETKKHPLNKPSPTPVKRKSN
jgi:cyclophilin family peptidyl-prolyl cis-trans isomerase